MKISPLRDRVVIKREDEEQVSAGGIFIPNTATEKPGKGQVIAVGSGVVDNNGERQTLDVTVGDTVIFGKTAGTEVTVDNEEFLVMLEEEIIAVIN
jgi:chaperonin GroES